MAPSLGTIALVTAHVVALAVGTLLYLRRFRMERPPIGVFNRRDILIITAAIIAIPPLYLQLPDVVVGAMLSLVALVILQFTLAPLTRSRIAWLLALLVVAVNVALALRGDGDVREPSFFAFNNVAIVILVLGVANLWTQAGLRAREVLLFAVLLTVYDVVAVTWLPAMVEFFFRAVQLPFAPAVVWGDGPGIVGVGIGDLLIVALWAAVTDKAFGLRAAVVAAASGVLAVLGILLAFWVGWLTEPMPAMVVLGPIVVVQYLIFRRIYGRERRVADYRPPDSPGPAGPARVATALSGPDAVAGALPLMPAGPAAGATNRYVAMAGSEILAEAPTAAEALQSARERRPGTVPVLLWTSRDGHPEEP